MAGLGSEVRYLAILYSPCSAFILRALSLTPTLTENLPPDAKAQIRGFRAPQGGASDFARSDRGCVHRMAGRFSVCIRGDANPALAIPYALFSLAPLKNKKPSHRFSMAIQLQAARIMTRAIQRILNGKLAGAFERWRGAAGRMKHERYLLHKALPPHTRRKLNRTATLTTHNDDQVVHRMLRRSLVAAFAQWREAIRVRVRVRVTLLT